MASLAAASVVLAVLQAATAAAAGAPVIVTEYGPIEGTVVGDVEVFHGVPFAAPPVGSMRWRPLQPPHNWTDVKPAVTVAPRCPQADLVRGEYVGSEDCMYLSVYRPVSCSSGQPCVVMQWIYGGAWISGGNDGTSGSYDATNLAQTHGVVVIAANYRLDVLGWLALDELAAEAGTGSFGNYGLQDQEFALRWTQRNAPALGGDPAKVTIFGESAGGFSVCQHLTRPGSDGLFSNAIMESGSCDGPWLILDGNNSRAWGSYYATTVGCPPGADPKERLACLRALSPAKIMEPYLGWLCPVSRPSDPWCNFTAAHQPSDGGLPRRSGEAETPVVADRDVPSPWPIPRPPLAPLGGWAATIDGTAQGLPETPYSSMLRGRVNKSPSGQPLNIIFGTNADEMALFLILSKIVFYRTHLPLEKGDLRLAAEQVVAYHQPSWNASTADRISDAYRADAGVFQNATAAYRLTRFGTDLAFLCNTRQAAAALTAAGARVFVYYFDVKTVFYRDPKSEQCAQDAEVLCGVFHSQEIKYVFGHKLLGPEEKAISAAMMTWWSNLAKHGDPAHGAAADEWPAYSKDAPWVMNIVNPRAQCNVTQGLPPESQCEMWDALPRFTY